MKSEWLNGFAIILFFFLFNMTDCSKVQFSAELPSELLGHNYGDSWHPHLRRKWVDEKNYIIYDNKKKVYPTSLIQLKTDNFLSESPTKNKMQCGCRFVKQEIVKSDSIAVKPAASFIELKENKPIASSVLPVSSYMETIAENLKMNNIVMSKIEHYLESQGLNNGLPINQLNQMNSSPLYSNFPPVNGPVNNQMMNPLMMNQMNDLRYNMNGQFAMMNTNNMNQIPNYYPTINNFARSNVPVYGSFYNGMQY